MDSDLTLFLKLAGDCSNRDSFQSLIACARRQLRAAYWFWNREASLHITRICYDGAERKAWHNNEAKKAAAYQEQTERIWQELLRFIPPEQRGEAISDIKEEDIIKE